MIGSSRRYVKALQKGCYSLLNSKLGAFAVFLSTMLLLNATLIVLDRRFGTFVFEQLADESATYLWPDDSQGGNLPSSSRCGGDYADNIVGASFERELCEEPIDAVYTWVNGSDDQHRMEVLYWQLKQKSEEWWNSAAEGDAKNSNRSNISMEASRLTQQQLDDQSSRSRFEDHDELRYSMRSLELYAGWVRHVYLVTNGQVPTWLNLSHPKISVVPHSVLFPNASHLPTFSSPAIESHLHRIPGLSEKFLYLNDDTFFAAPVQPSDFYSRTKGHRLFYSWPVPQCSDGCPAAWLGDGTCDRQCNTSSCDYDSGDCLGPNVKVLGGGGGHAAVPSSQGRGATPLQANKHCHSTCADGWIGDRYCDATCNVRHCGYDGADCGVSTLQSDTDFLKLSVELPAEAESRFSSTGSQRPTSLTVRNAFFVDAAVHKSFALNLSNVFPIGKAKIVAGDHDSMSWVRSATVSQGAKLLVVTIVDEWSEKPRRCTFVIEGEREIDVTDGGTVKARTPVADMSRTAIAGRIGQRFAQANPSSVSVVTTPIKLIVNVTLTALRTTNRRSGPRQTSASAIPTVSRSFSPEDVGLEQRKLMQLKGEESDQDAAWMKTLCADDERAVPGDERSLPLQFGQSLRSPTQRRLMDLFGDSLKHTNLIITRKFKSTSRKVPAHMVHLIRKDVMEALWAEWPVEWNETSASKFRSRSNLQYAFMHYYWMVHAVRELSPEEQFTTFLDVDRSTVVEYRELRRAAVLLWEKEVTHGALDEVAVAILESCFPVKDDERQNATSTDATAGGNESNVSSSTGKHTLHLLGNATCTSLLTIPGTEYFMALVRERRPNRTLPDAGKAADAFSRQELRTTHSHSMTDRSPLAIHDGKLRMRNHSRASSAPHTTHAPTPSPSPPAPAYRVPSTNPDDKIRPMTKEYLRTVTWLVLAAASGAHVLPHNSTCDSHLSYPDWRVVLSPQLKGLALSNVGIPLSASQLRDSHIGQILKSHYGTVRRYKTTIEELDDVTFVMVRNNATVVQHQMDHIRQKRPKFLCVNDDMNHSSTEFPVVLSIVQELLDSYYPRASSFELADGLRNDFVRLSSESSLQPEQKAYRRNAVVPASLSSQCAVIVIMLCVVGVVFCCFEKFYGVPGRGSMAL